MENENELINNIKVNDKDIEDLLLWLGKEPGNGLYDYQCSSVIRFLLQKVNKLEIQLGELQKP